MFHKQRQHMIPWELKYTFIHFKREGGIWTDTIRQPIIIKAVIIWELTTGAYVQITSQALYM